MEKRRRGQKWGPVGVGGLVDKSSVTEQDLGTRERDSEDSGEDEEAAE